jgi:ubiquitin-protein ligase E3 C
MDAIRDTLSAREVIVLSEVLSHADACRQRPRSRYQDILVHAIPAVLQYALRHQQDLTILATFAARGEDVASYVLGATKRGGTDATDAAPVAAAEAHEGEDTDEENDDDDDDDDDDDGGDRPAQQLPQRSAARDTSAASTARYARADLQTLPRLDALYQTSALRARQATVDRLRSVPRGHGAQVELLVALAEKIGRGEWIEQLGDALFSPSQSQPSTSLLVLLTPLSWPHWQGRAQLAYTAALATVMTSCSGIKAGRNAASPLLAKLAFSETFLDGMWKRSIWNIELLVSQPKTTEDSSAIASACELLSSFCDGFSHQLLAVNDDDFLRRYHRPEDSIAPDSTGRAIVARDVVRILRVIMNDLYWIRPVLASDITNSQNDPDSNLRFHRARVFLSGTKLWNSLHERWCRLYRVVQFCEEDCWWFPQLVSRGQHENNPIIQSQVTSFGGQENDDMDERSVGSAHMDDGMDESATISQHDAGGDALANTFRDPKMARVLTYIPQAMPFSRRVNLFNSLLESDKLRTQDETMSLRQMMMNFEEEAVTEISGRERVTIRRDLLYSDSKHLLMQLGKRLRKRVQVTFVNKYGQQEAGIDGGGVFKEFLDDLIRDAFLPETVRGESAEGDDDDSVIETHPDFFSVTPLQTLTVNTALDGNDLLSHYEFLGRVLGKAIYGESLSLSFCRTCLFVTQYYVLLESESILVEPQFCLPFLNKLLGKQNSLDDLKNLDPEYYRNLMSLRHLSAEETRDLGLSFELHESTTATIELMPGGSTIPVFKENVIQFIHLAAHQKMNVRGSRQTAAFLHGFRDIIPSQWVRLFSAYELQKLISGDDAVKGIDVRGMMAVMRYSGGLHPTQPIVHWLWEVVDEMTPDQQRKFLKFMTSCSRQPLLGFASMVPAPCIQQTRLREDHRGNDIAEDLGIGNIRLPTSSTCMNLLKLPKYTSKEMLKEKLLYAIEAAAGFELS